MTEDKVEEIVNKDKSQEITVENDNCPTRKDEKNESMNVTEERLQRMTDAGRDKRPDEYGVETGVNREKRDLAYDTTK